MNVHKPHLVLHYERRASGFYEAARDLEVLGEAKYHPRYLRRGRRPSSSGFGEAFASTGAERTWVLEHRSAAETKPKLEIGGRPGPLRYRRWAKYLAAIGLLAVHGCIALADAVLVAVEGNRGCGEDHAEVARRLRSWCSARKVDPRGIKHLEWLLSKKSHFSYAEATVTDEELQRSKLKMDQFFGWAFRTFPAVAQLPNDA